MNTNQITDHRSSHTGLLNLQNTGVSASYCSRANAEVENFIKNFGKVIRTAKITGMNKMQALQDFIRVYNETPHSTTKVAPAMLMLGLCRTSGIPQASNVPNMKLVSFLHKRAVDND